MAKFFNKKKLVLILAAAAMSVGVAAATGCKEKVEQITITRNNAPQTTYVYGSDLNLSSGKLTVIVEGEKREISLSDPEVSISGYDKNTLGEQILTVTYKEQTTVLKVTVVPRMSVGRYEEAYFVGEPIDLTKGELTITADNGESTFVAMDDASVTVTGFDSTAQNEALPLTVTYNSGNETYTTTIDVAIYEAKEVNFTAPGWSAYKSHDTALNVSGGYLTLKADGLTRNVVVTEDMVSGFDPSAATVEHRGGNYLLQTLTVNYCGYEQEYKIQITYSDVSLIHLRASEMDDIAWSGAELPADFDAQVGENALEAMAVYFEMSEPDLKLLQEGAIDYIVKVATVYGFDKWMDAFEDYSAAFYYSEDGSLSWDCSNFEATSDAYDRIANKDPIMYEDGATLTKIRDNFAEFLLEEEGDTIADYLTQLCSPETIDSFIGQLKLMIDLHNALKVIPAEWNLDELKTNTTYAEAIYTAWELLFSTEYKATQQRSLYLLTSKWREKNDFFEILYTFYYDFYTNENDNPYDNDAKYPVKGDLKWINAFKDLRLPGQLENLYQILLTVRSELIYVRQYAIETTTFMRAYETALALKEQILASNDTMAKELYTTLEFDYLIGDGAGSYQQITFDGLFLQYRRSQNGYIHNFNVYLGVDAYEKLWKDYMSVLDQVSVAQAANPTEEVDLTQFGEQIENLMFSYMALTPKQQFAFMNLLHPYYIPSQAGRFPAYAWSNDEAGVQSQFTYLIYTYYESILPEETHDILTQLMLAMEAIANYQIVYIDLQAFFDAMDDATATINRLKRNNAGKAKWEEFNNKLGELYNMLLSYDLKFRPEDGSEAKPETLTPQESELLGALLNASYEAYWMMAYYDMYGSGLALPFLAAMENVEYLTGLILASENAALHRAYAFDAIFLENVAVPEGYVTNFGGTMDSLVYLIRKMYASALTGMSYLTMDVLMYDAYEQMGVKDFVANASYLFFTNIITKVEAGQIKYKNEEAVMSVAEAFREVLTDDQRYFLFVLDGQYRFYIRGMLEFADERNSEMHGLVSQLHTVEMMYVYAKKDPTMKDEDGKPYVEYLQEEYEVLLEDYQVLLKAVEDEKENKRKLEAGEIGKGEIEINEKLISAMDDFNTYFGEMYAYYLEKCPELFPAEE